MKINDKTFNMIFGPVFFFTFNLAVSSLCMLFLPLSFRECLVYSTVNGLWMWVVIPWIMNRFHFREL